MAKIGLFLPHRQIQLPHQPQAEQEESCLPKAHHVAEKRPECTLPTERNKLCQERLGLTSPAPFLRLTNQISSIPSLRKRKKGDVDKELFSLLLETKSLHSDWKQLGVCPNNTLNLWGRFLYYLHITDQEAEAQREVKSFAQRLMIIGRSKHQNQRASSEPKHSASEPCCLHPEWAGSLGECQVVWHGWYMWLGLSPQYRFTHSTKVPGNRAGRGWPSAQP